MTQTEQEENLNFLRPEPSELLENIPIPLSIELSEEDRFSIRSIFIPRGNPLRYPQDFAVHLKELTNITKQVKCISAQSILLHGERIKQAQEILSNYCDGTFTKWLIFAFGNTRTPYCILSYYEFFHRAPEEFRAIIESAPKKCIYNLAARTGNNADKLDFIKEHGMKPQSDLLQLIQKKFPARESDKRRPKSPRASIFNAIEKLCEKLESQSESITEDDRIKIQKLIDRLQKL